MSAVDLILTVVINVVSTLQEATHAHVHRVTLCSQTDGLVKVSDITTPVADLEVVPEVPWNTISWLVTVESSADFLVLFCVPNVLY